LALGCIDVEYGLCARRDSQNRENRKRFHAVKNRQPNASGKRNAKETGATVPA
jgi:hypothetical protein